MYQWPVISLHDRTVPPRLPSGLGTDDSGELLGYSKQAASQASQASRKTSQHISHRFCAMWRTPSKTIQGAARKLVLVSRELTFVLHLAGHEMRMFRTAHRLLIITATVCGVGNATAARATSSWASIATSVTFQIRNPRYHPRRWDDYGPTSGYRSA